MVPIISDSMWEINIPQLAFTSPIVLDALLSISALHLLALQPGDQSLAFASRLYFSKALKKQRDSVTNINAENAEPLLVGAVLIAHHTWLAAHITGSPNDRYDMALQTYLMCQGIQTLIQNAWPWLQQYTFTPEKIELEEDAAQKTGFLKLALEDMASISAHFYEDGVPPEDSDAYNRTANEIRTVYSLLTHEPFNGTRIEQTIVTILHRVPTRFVELLRTEDPLAMAIMARNLSLLTFSENSKAWWIYGAGDKKVSSQAVLGIRRLMPADWMWTMTWPMNIISKKIKLDFD